MNLRDSAQEIADVAMDAISKADEQSLDLDVLSVVFTIVIRDDKGKVRTVTSTWTDPE